MCSVPCGEKRILFFAKIEGGYRLKISPRLINRACGKALN